MPSPSFTAFNTGIKITPQDDGDAIIETNHGKINLDEFWKITSDMLCIIPEDKKLHEKDCPDNPDNQLLDFELNDENLENFINHLLFFSTKNAFCNF